MYKIIQKLLFLFNPEAAHHIATFFLKYPIFSVFLKKLYHFEDKSLEKELFGLTFKNPVGIAAGFDKNAEFINGLDDIGFGFVEIGTVTPLAQDGNPKPRLFRLKKDKAIINRMGFNNAGMDASVKNIKKRRKGILLGGNIGKNKITPNENAVDDYVKCFKTLYDYVDYFVVNISSPNTPNLRELQDKEPLQKLLHEVQTLNKRYPKKKPLLLKIAPDLSNTQLDEIIEIVQEEELSGIIATNTTIDRKALKTSEMEIYKIGAGGLSGKPLHKRSLEVIRYISDKTKGQLPIIAVGGIQSSKDALNMLESGASLIQIYTGFIYEGPELVKKIKKAIVKSKK